MAVRTVVVRSATDVNSPRELTDADAVEVGD
jgi:hypothetical protein